MGGSMSNTVTTKALSANQKAFVRAAKRAGHDVFYTYSGRGMYGDRCPAFVTSPWAPFKSRARFQTDNMGRDVVIYAQY